MFHKLLAAYFAGFLGFWVLGIDQLYFSLFCLVGMMAYLLSIKTPLRPEVLVFGAFVLITMASAPQVPAGFRYATYLRNEGVYIAMLFILLSSSFAASRRPEHLDRMYYVLLIFSLQCSVIAFIASSGYNISFKTPAAYVIPDLGSQYIRGMLNKSIIQAEATWFAEGFFRPRGLMLYPNTMAGVLCASMALKAYFSARFWSEGKRVFALVCVLAIGLDFFSVYSSLSRSTWLGFGLALAIFPFLFKSQLKTKLVPIGVAALAVALVFATGLNEGIQSRLTDKTHSNEGRGLNYVLIWEMTTSSLDTFLVGHGTQRDHPDLTIPVGSHSTYLGMFFKYGTLGLLFFMGFIFMLYRSMWLLTRHIHTLSQHGYVITRPYFVCFGLIVLLVQMIFIEVDVDASYAMFVAALMYVIIKEREVLETLVAELETQQELADTPPLLHAQPA